MHVVHSAGATILSVPEVRSTRGLDLRAHVREKHKKVHAQGTRNGSCVTGVQSALLYFTTSVLYSLSARQGSIMGITSLVWGVPKKITVVHYFSRTSQALL